MVQNITITIPETSTSSIYSMDSPQSLASGISIASAGTSISSENFAETPLTALSKNTKRQLSYLLNSKKVIRSEDGYERDWRGIAALAQLKSLCDEASISGDDPMMKVLQYWCSNNPKTATFGNLEKYLGIIDRWDVSDDICENLAEDAKIYTTHLQRKTLQLIDENDGALHRTNNLTTQDDFGLGSDPNILTNDDVLRAQQGLPPQKYDAFVLFATADIKYAVEMIEKLEENPEYKFKLCLKDRDLLAGVSFAHVALTQLIEERCKHLIVILTEEFIKSPENKFLVNYTQALQIENKTRKIIPLLYDDSVVIPRTLKIYTHLKYTANIGTLFNFWQKLAASIRNVSIAVESPATVYSKELHSATLSKRSVDPLKSSLAKLPTPPTEIPSININGEAFLSKDDETMYKTMPPKKKERMKFAKRSSLRNSSNKALLSDNGAGSGMMRNALSTSQLNAYDSNHSMSDLSSPDLKEKKRRGLSKLFKKVFSRSSSKLQEPA